MKTMDRRGEGRFGLLLGIALALGVIVWQVQRGATVQKIGIPGVFEIDLGKPAPKFCMAEEAGYDRFGSDYNGGPQMRDLEQCKESCLLDEQCQALSFNRTSKQCWLKNAPGLRQPNETFISAVKVRC